MTYQRRKARMLELLDQHESLNVPELALKLDVSPVTIRRDLTLLAEKGLLTRTHGGAVSLKASAEKIGFRHKLAAHHAEKEYIAQRAARYIDDGDIIFMDCGSTVFALAPFLKGKRITVITNSLPLASALSEANVRLNLVGGELDQDRMAIHGAVAVEHIRRYKAFKAFVGVDGISIERGLSANSEKEAEITQAMMSQSKKVFLLCDSSKIGEDKYLAFAPVSTVDYLVTDNSAPDPLITPFREAGVVIIN